MEDYTYHFAPDNNLVLGAHMLEICPTIAAHKPSCEVHPLGIGGKEDPVRLVFDSAAGTAINASMIDMGNRFRLIVNEVESVEAVAPLPKLPVARVLWRPFPNLKTAAAAWILAGGAHHTGFSHAITTEHMEDFADMLDLELLVIDQGTDLRDFKNQLKWNEVYYQHKKEF
jgi:L-arabinose isomerase